MRRSKQLTWIVGLRLAVWSSRQSSTMTTMSCDCGKSFEMNLRRPTHRVQGGLAVIVNLHRA